MNGVTESIEMLVIPDTISIQRPPTCGIVLLNGAQKWWNLSDVDTEITDMCKNGRADPIN